jgi:hypothetical protein
VVEASVLLLLIGLGAVRAPFSRWRRSRAAKGESRERAPIPEPL